MYANQSVVADEPTGNLDGETEAQILDLLWKLAHEDHKCVIVVTHSERVAKVCDTVYRLAGNLEPEHGFSAGAAHAVRNLMLLKNTPGNGQSQSGSGDPGLADLVQTVVTFPDPRQFLVRDWIPLVPDFNAAVCPVN